MSNLKDCKACGNTFRGASYMKFCDDCFSDVRKHTVPAAESKHPALIYETEHPTQELGKATPEEAAPYLAELQTLLADIEEEVKKSTVNMLTCEHDFKKMPYFTQCTKCDMPEHQFLYSIQVEPRTRFLGDPQ